MPFPSPGNRITVYLLLPSRFLLTEFTYMQVPLPGIPLYVHLFFSPFAPYPQHSLRCSDAGPKSLPLLSSLSSFSLFFPPLDTLSFLPALALSSNFCPCPSQNPLSCHPHSLLPSIISLLFFFSIPQLPSFLQVPF